jgi:hypothetical protein
MGIAGWELWLVVVLVVLGAVALVFVAGLVLVKTMPEGVRDLRNLPVADRRLAIAFLGLIVLGAVGGVAIGAASASPGASDQDFTRSLVHGIAIGFAIVIPIELVLVVLVARKRRP